MNPRVKGVLFNIFGGIVRGDEVASGILEATRTMDIKVPIVVRLSGTKADEGREMLKGTNLIPATHRPGSRPQDHRPGQATGLKGLRTEG